MRATEHIGTTRTPDTASGVLPHSERIRTMTTMLTPAEAAEVMGLSRVRVYQLINEGRLPVERHGVVILIRRDDAEAHVPRPIGRPRKSA